MELFVGDLVVRFVFTVIGVSLLDSIICQVDLRLEGVYVELVRRSADVPLFIPIGTVDSKKVSDQHVMPYIELPVVVEQRPVNIHLHDVSTLSLLRNGTLRWHPPLLDDRIQLIHFIDYCNASTLVAVLPRLHDPDVSCLGRGVGPLLLFSLALFLDEFGPPLIVIQKSRILGILKAFADMKCEGDVVKEALADETVVLFEVIEEGLFVAEIEVELEMVVNDTAVFRYDPLEFFGIGRKLKIIVPLFRLFIFVPVSLIQLRILPMHEFAIILLVGRIKQGSKLQSIHSLALL